MPFRKLLLRIMLWALGAAAVLGAISVVVFPTSVAGKIVGTALVTAGAAALLMPMAMLTERPAARWTGLLGMAMILSEFLLSILLIWDIPGLFGSPDDALAFSMLWIFLCVPPAMICLACVKLPAAKVAGWTGAIISGVVFVILMAGNWTGRGFWAGNWELQEIGGVIALFGFLAIVCLVGTGTDRRYWRYAGVVASIAGAGIAVAAILLGLHGDSGVFVHAVTIAAVIAHANICEACPLPGRQRLVGRLTILMAATTGVLVDLLIVRDLDIAGELLTRIASATGILAACGTLALGVMVAINRRIERPAIIFQSVQKFTAICPVCELKQTLPAGEARCGRCRLVIRTQFEEPHCPTCNYSLFMLTSDRCPECGTVV